MYRLLGASLLLTVLGLTAWAQRREGGEPKDSAKLNAGTFHAGAISSECRACPRSAAQAPATAPGVKPHQVGGMETG